MIQRGDLEVDGCAAGAVVMNGREEEAIHFDADELRWLLTTAIPAVLAIPEPAVKVRDASNDESQIKGQLAIDCGR